MEILEQKVIEIKSSLGDLNSVLEKAEERVKDL